MCQANRSISDDELEACDGCCRGADPNRNWDVSWGSKFFGVLLLRQPIANQDFGDSVDTGTTETYDCTHACCDTFAGRHAFSEPEVKAMATFLRENQHRINLFLSVHSYSQMWLTPYAYSSHVQPEEHILLVRSGSIFRIVDQMFASAAPFAYGDSNDEERARRDI